VLGHLGREACRAAQVGDLVVQLRADRAGQQHEGRVRQLCERNDPLGRERVCGRQNGHGWLGQQGLEIDLCFPGGRLAQQADVDGLVVQGGDLRRGGHLMDVQMYAGEPAPEDAQ